ncbi:uncharacterized protein LOC126807979 isoform X2 [Patella vulgata]|uniref:uncharacterized protein LOC126807979 isoform X2 n=1 Tax=Patella vulgata TaxID=6465 RepID=UPI0024A807E6|nr:uncharacterized protein LOC126807979 isoform X2 [Patella vulgata]
MIILHISHPGLLNRSYLYTCFWVIVRFGVEIKTSTFSDLDNYQTGEKVDKRAKSIIRPIKSTAQSRPDPESERGSCNASSCFNPIIDRGYRDLGKPEDDEDYPASNAEQDIFCFDKFGGSETARTDTAGSSNVEVEDSCTFKAQPSSSSEAIPGTSSEVIPGSSSEVIPGSSSETIPGTSSETIPGTSSVVIPSRSFTKSKYQSNQHKAKHKLFAVQKCEIGKERFQRLVKKELFQNKEIKEKLKKEIKRSMNSEDGKNRVSAPNIPNLNIIIQSRSEDKTVPKYETGKEHFQRLLYKKEIKEKLKEKIKGRMKSEEEYNRVSAPNIPNFEHLIPWHSP